jgi:hypothetical protein
LSSFLAMGLGGHSAEYSPDRNHQKQNHPVSIFEQPTTGCW